MINWPCLLKLDGDGELIYLAQEQYFQSVCADLILSDDDYVVDSLGVQYAICAVPLSKNMSLKKTSKVISIDELTNLIRAHEFTKAELCITKIYFSTISEAIHSMSHYDEST